MKWGKPIWTFFHVTAQKMKSEYFTAIIKDYFNYIVLICSVLPCPVCSDHASQYMRSININNINPNIKPLLWLLRTEVSISGINNNSNKGFVFLFKPKSWEKPKIGNPTFNKFQINKPSALGKIAKNPKTKANEGVYLNKSYCSLVYWVYKFNWPNKWKNEFLKII